LKAQNIEFLWNSTVSDLIFDKRISGATLKNVNTGDLSELVCDGIFISIGRNPATELFQGIIDLDKNGYIEDFSKGRFHHEIYLSDPRKCSTDKLKTVIRHPIKKK
jgi:thioredoxin reductase